MGRFRLRDIILFGVSLLVLAAFTVATFAKFNHQFFTAVWWDFVWWVLAGCLILIFCGTVWTLLESESDMRNRRQPSEEERTRIAKDLREIHLTHFGHAHQEMTRYRDLPWKIGALTWAIYYALIWLRSEKPLLRLTNISTELFFFFTFSTAMAACVFVLFCEVSANRNRSQRREIAEVLGLHERWRSTEAGERLTRPGFWFSMLVFLSASWFPPLWMLFYRTIQ